MNDSSNNFEDKVEDTIKDQSEDKTEDVAELEADAQDGINADEAVFDDADTNKEAEDSSVKDLEAIRPYRELAKLSAYRVTATVLALATSLCGVLCAIFALDGKSRYFENSPLTATLWILIAISVAFSLSALFVFKSKHKIELCKYPRLAGLWGNVPALIALSFPAIIFVGNYSTAFKALAAIVCVLCAMSSLAHLFTFSPNLKLICSYCEILVSIFIISSLYIDLSIEMNSPLKLLIQFSAAAVMIGTLCDCHKTIGHVSPKTHVGAKSIVCIMGLLCGAVCISLLIHRPETLPLSYYAYAAFLAAHSVSAAIALFYSNILASDPI